MRKQVFKNHAIFLMLGAWLLIAISGTALAQSSFSVLENLDIFLLQPYFNGKNWKASVEDNITINLPDTLSSQQLRPAKFDIGKSLDSTLAAFSTATGDFFLMESQYFHYAGACQDELDFLCPSKSFVNGNCLYGYDSMVFSKRYGI